MGESPHGFPPNFPKPGVPQVLHDALPVAALDPTEQVFAVLARETKVDLLLQAAGDGWDPRVIQNAAISPWKNGDFAMKNVISPWKMLIYPWKMVNWVHKMLGNNMVNWLMEPISPNMLWIQFTHDQGQFDPVDEWR